MDADLIARAEADAKLAEEEFDGKNLQELGVLALALEQEIEDHEAIVSSKKKELERVMRYAIPDALTAAGISGCEIEHGNRTASLSMGTKVVGSLNYAPDLDAAIAYLEGAGMRNAIKSVVSLDFTEEEKEQADNLVVAIDGITGRKPATKRDLHPQTLAAFARERVKEDPTFDFEKVGLQAFPQAKFTKRK